MFGDSYIGIVGNYFGGRGVKLKLPVLLGLPSTIQSFSHPLTFNFLWSLGYFRKLAFGSPWGNISLPVCVQQIYGAQEYQTCTETALSGYQFTTWSSGTSEIYVLCSQKFRLDQCMIRTTDLSICRRTRYHWINAPRQHTLCCLNSLFNIH